MQLTAPNSFFVIKLIKIMMYLSLQRFLNKGQSPTVTFQKNTKEEFLSEHNRLSPLNMQTTMSLLSRFRIERTALFKNEDWSLDKLRRPFIIWLVSLAREEKEKINDA